MLKDYQGALEDLDKADVLEPNDAFTLRSRGDVKIMLKDYQGALEDLDKVDVLEPNDASTLSSHGPIKYILDDYEGALQDLDKVHVFEPNNASTLIIRGCVNDLEWKRTYDKWCLQVMWFNVCKIFWLERRHIHYKAISIKHSKVKVANYLHIIKR
jgi:tetratricopeptide (TPR) repeat protein